MRPRRWRRESCNELLVQQLVLACSAAIRKELALLQLGLSQRCAGGSYRDLRGDGRAIAMPIGCRALPWASRLRGFCTRRTIIRPGRSFQDVSRPRRKETIRESSSIKIARLSQLPLPRDACGLDASSGTRRPSTSSHGPQRAAPPPRTSRKGSPQPR